MEMEYETFIKSKAHSISMNGFEPLWMPDFLFDFQKELTSWAIKKGRGALFEDCGLGKTLQQLVWAENIVRKTNKNVLIITPLAVSHQTVKEGVKFGIECKRSDNGKVYPGITVTNYERLHLFNHNDFIGAVCDESSILKNFNGSRKLVITEFMKKLQYRLLCTATAAPNDYIELGTSAEALGEMGFMDMLGKFFKNMQNTCDTKRHWSATGGGAPKWVFRPHAEIPFWKWICSWAKAIRQPSDIGFENDKFSLPPLLEKQTIVKNTRPFDGELLVRPVIGLKEQRQELRMTLKERCEKVAELVAGNDTAVVWCNLNDEGDFLEKIIDGGVQVAGKHTDKDKEEKLAAFSEGNIRVLITKPKIAGFGLNWQHCAHLTFFPSHSFEQYYQCMRRCWRFGQKNPVTVDIVTTDGEISVLKNMQRKSEAANKMFSELIKYMNASIVINTDHNFNQKVEVPSWM